MTVNEKVQYIKGLAEGMELGDSKESKLILKMLEVLEDIALEIEDIEDACSDMAEQIDAVDEDLADVEEEFYGDCDCDDCCDDCDDDDCCYEVECPNCNDVIYLDEDMIEEGGIKCPNCGTELEFDLDDCDGECDCCDHAEDCE